MTIIWPGMLKGVSVCTKQSKYSSCKDALSVSAWCKQESNSQFNVIVRDACKLSQRICFALISKSQMLVYLFLLTAVTVWLCCKRLLIVTATQPYLRHSHKLQPSNLNKLSSHNEYYRAINKVTLVRKLRYVIVMGLKHPYCLNL